MHLDEWRCQVCTIRRSGGALLLAVAGYDIEAGMTITLELPPDAEAKLVAQAKARGLSLDAFIRTIITTQAAAFESTKLAQALPVKERISIEQSTRFSTLFKSHLE